MLAIKIIHKLQYNKIDKCVFLSSYESTEFKKIISVFIKLTNLRKKVVSSLNDIEKKPFNINYDKKNLHAYMNSSWTDNPAGKAWGEVGAGWRMSMGGMKGTAVIFSIIKTNLKN